MELMKQDDIEGALTDYHKDLQGTDNGAKRNEETTRTNWGHYADVIWKLKGTVPGYDDRELYRIHIRSLRREEFAEAVKRLDSDLREWDRDKIHDATDEQVQEMVKAYAQRNQDIIEEKHRPLEEEGERTIYPPSGNTKLMNIMRELKAVKTEKEEKGAAGETYDGKKEEEGRKEEEEEQEEKEETAPPSEEKEDGREENTKQGQTTLLNDGRTELNEKGKKEALRLAENIQRIREEKEKTHREEHRRHEEEKR